MKLFSFLALVGLTSLTVAQNSTNFITTLNSTLSTTGPRNVRIDTGTYGSEVEEFHYYYGQLVSLYPRPAEPSRVTLAVTTPTRSARS
jgi:hypothetical protein